MKRKRAYPAIELYRSNAAPVGAPKRGGDWYWRLRATNGRIIADGSEGYAKRGNAIRAARRAKAIMASALRWEFR